MIKKYLEERKEILSNKIRNNKEKYDHNQIAIDESKNQIKELNEMVDEAEKIFSVKAREDNGFKNQEINDLEKRIAAYMIENQEYEKNIDEANEELSVVVKCLDELNKYIVNSNILMLNDKETDNVSRETHEINLVKNEYGGLQLELNDSFERLLNKEDNKELLQKLEFCKSIAEIDGKRVSIELDNIINSIK